MKTIIPKTQPNGKSYLTPFSRRHRELIEKAFPHSVGYELEKLILQIDDHVQSKPDREVNVFETLAGRAFALSNYMTGPLIQAEQVFIDPITGHELDANEVAEPDQDHPAAMWTSMINTVFASRHVGHGV